MNDKPIKLAVCVPSGDDVKASFAICLAEMFRVTDVELSGGRRIEVAPSIENMRTAMLPYSRNLLVEIALAKGADYVLFVDSDMVFPPDTMTHLLAQMIETGAKILGCVYPSRRVHGNVAHREQL